MIKYSSFPRAIEIQTMSRCNGMCAICPYGDVADYVSHGVMKKDLFEKIIDQIKNPWGVRIIPYFNNEPFLDPYFIDRLKYINKKCPGAEIEVSTNVSMLNKTMQDRMLGIEIKDLRMSVFGFSPRTHKRIMRGLSWNNVASNLRSIAVNKKLRSSIGQLSLVMIDYPGITQKDIELARKFCANHFIKFELWGFLDRSDNVKDYKNNIYKKNIIGCEQDRPLDRMHIRYDGKVVLCCMDWRSEYALGDLNKNSLQEIWDSAQYNNMRESIYSGKGNPPQLCKKCKLAI